MGLQSAILDKVVKNFSGKPGYKVKFGKLVSLEETVVAGQLYDFTAGRVKLKGKKFIRDFELMDFAAGAMLTDDIANLFDSNTDALWVQSRIMHDFKTASLPAKDYIKPALMAFEFLAVERCQGEVEAYPFICTDHNGRAALIFSPYGPSQAIQRKIASDFWHIQLTSPANLFDFDAQAELGGATIHYGRRKDKFYYEEG